ncbi:hypothetical protein BGZ76_005960 [Entomortierella beljakovae]|nr:hypothetical protein BGZ76_005960 [Entomortierella beljakovae]
MEELLQEKAQLQRANARVAESRAKVDNAIKETLTNADTARYAYVTVDDIKKVKSLNDSLILAVSTPYETYMDIDDGISKPSHFTMNLEHKTHAGDVKLNTFVVQCPGSPFTSDVSSAGESGSDFSDIDEFSQDDDSSTDLSSDSSSEDDSDLSSSYSSSDDESDMSESESEDEDMPTHRMMIGEHTFESSMSPQDVEIIYRTAEGMNEENEAEYMSE